MQPRPPVKSHRHLPSTGETRCIVAQPREGTATVGVEGHSARHAPRGRDSGFPQPQERKRERRLRRAGRAQRGPEASTQQSSQSCASVLSSPLCGVLGRQQPPCPGPSPAWQGQCAVGGLWWRWVLSAVLKTLTPLRSTARSQAGRASSRPSARGQPMRKAHASLRGRSPTCPACSASQDATDWVALKTALFFGFLFVLSLYNH